MVPLVELRGAIPFAIANGGSLMDSAPDPEWSEIFSRPSDLLFARHILTWGQKTSYRRFLADVSIRAIEADRN